MSDVVVIGGGVIGLSIAHELVEQGLSVRVLEQGQIVEKGRHDELMARGGLYSQLYRLQFDA